MVPAGVIGPIGLIGLIGPMGFAAAAPEALRAWISAGAASNPPALFARTTGCGEAEDSGSSSSFSVAIRCRGLAAVAGRASATGVEGACGTPEPVDRLAAGA